MKHTPDTHHEALLSELLLRRFQTKYLPPVWRLENSDSSKLIVSSIATISILLLCLILWLIFTNVEEIAITTGKIIPFGDVLSIQHLEGGIISAVYIKEGETVKPGQLLVKLDPTAAISDLQQMQIHALGLVSNKTLEPQLNALKNKIPTFSDQLKTLNNQFILQEKELTMYQKLVKNGIVSRKDYLVEQRLLNQIQGQIDNTKSEYAQAIWLINKLEDRVKRSDIRSPTYGVIQGFESHVGSVIKPGDIIMNIVPVKQKLVVEAKISTTDIGHLQLGAPVKIKIKTFDYTRYGILDGKLQDISATTFTDENNMPYYKGIISLNRNYVSNNPNINQLRPGMTVEADIHTGSKSLLSYLLKPVKTALTSSFHER